MIVQLIRHATYRILIDPIFSPAGTLAATPDPPNQRANPLVELPVELDSLLHPYAILLTYMHRDHFDVLAAKVLPKDLPFFCQPEEKDKIVELGFRDVRPIENSIEWKSIQWFRTNGQQGTGEIGFRFCSKAKEEPTLYISGDTIWCKEVQNALSVYQPEVIVLFSGAAQYLTGDPITMTKDDVLMVRQILPKSKIIVVHLEAWNHGLLSREELRSDLREQGCFQNVFLPGDGEQIEIV